MSNESTSLFLFYLYFIELSFSSFKKYKREDTMKEEKKLNEINGPVLLPEGPAVLLAANRPFRSRIACE